jgi:site-specific recombinase XerD
MRDRAILETLYGTGVRIGEAVRTDLQDLDLGQGVLLVRNGKGKKDRVVPISGRAAAALERYMAVRLDLQKRPDMALFLSRYGSRLSIVGLRAAVQRHGRAIGLQLGPHSLRHACATHLLQGGADIRHVQELLGHRSLMTTALYTKVAIKDLRAVLARSHPRA